MMYMALLFYFLNKFENTGMRLEIIKMEFITV